MNRSNNYARAPYNFVPLPTDKKGEYNPLPGKTADHDRYDDKRHTGYFYVTLETITPLFVRGMLTSEEVQAGKEAKDHPGCFMVNGKPVIPGSSLRGMIRSLVEIITFGKMHFVADALMLYRSVFGDDALVELYRGLVTEIKGSRHFVYPHKRLKGGYLIRDSASESGWGIQPAMEPAGESFVLVNLNAITNEIDRDINPQRVNQKPQQVWVKPASRTRYRNRVTLEIAETSRISKTPFGGGERATLVFSKTVGRRHWYPAIFEQNTGAKPVPISRKIWQTYIDDRDMNRGISTRKLEHEGDPLFYLVDDVGELVFFGPTMFFRLPYENSVAKLIPSELLDTNCIDYAEALFGFVPENDKDTRQAYAGRVFVTSATLDEGQSNLYQEEFTPKILSSPKPTTFQHYLEQPKGKDTQKRELYHYGSLENGKPKARIRGQKLYWRQNIKGIESVKERPENIRQNDTQHTRIQPLRAGVHFTFRVYFENLSDAELGALAWALTLGGDKDAHHMLGMGKPYGLGVVKLTPTLYLSKRRERYSQLFDTNGQWYRAEDKQDDSADFITAFKNEIEKHTGKPFEENERIQQLMVMLHLYTPDINKFGYMELDAFTNRPVLPKPNEVV